MRQCGSIGRGDPRGRGVVVLGVLCVSVATLAAARAQSADVGLRPDRVRQLVEEFKRGRGAAAREESAAELLEGGPAVAAQLLPIAESERVRLLRSYTARFQRAVGDVLKERRRKGDAAAEIAGLRRRILDVAAADALTKEMIESQSDPALARLEALMLVSPEEAVARQPQLDVDRTELRCLAGIVRRCRELRPDPDRAAAGAEVAEDDLTTVEELCCLMAGPATPADRQTLAANARAGRDLDPEEARGILRLNTIRILVGLPAQAIDPGLVAACRGHSRDMAEHDFFAHESPLSGRETPWKRAEAAGTSASAENIFSGVDDGRAAIEGWWHSPGHHRNMLGNQSRTGLGRWKELWTQLFG